MCNNIHLAELLLRIIKIKTLRDFWSHPEYSDSEQSLKSWYAIAKSADWVTPHDVKDRFGNASIIGDNRVVFNIAGNKYRLIVKFNYPHGVGYIRFMGTHRQYDSIDAETI
jgi:mRNA interferase HigB